MNTITYIELYRYNMHYTLTIVGPAPFYPFSISDFTAVDQSSTSYMVSDDVPAIFSGENQMIQP